MLHIHQYRVCIIHKPGPDLYIADWLSRNNHAEDRDQEIIGMNKNVNAISTAVNMLVCISTEDIQVVTYEDASLEKVRLYVIQGLPHKEDKLEHNIVHSWPIRSKLAINDGITIKVKGIVIFFLLQKQILWQLHSNHIGIEKRRLLALE